MWSDLYVQKSLQRKLQKAWIRYKKRDVISGAAHRQNAGRGSNERRSCDPAAFVRHRTLVR